MRLWAAALVPGIWIYFSLVFARADSAKLSNGFKAVVAGAFVLPVLCLLPMSGPFFSGEVQRLPGGWVLALAGAGYGFFVVALLALVLVLVLLERTLRASVGRQRWQVKFYVLGIGGIMAARLAVVSYTLVYRAVNLEMELIASAALIAACPLVLVAMRRAGGLQLDLYFSQKTLFNSVTLIVVGLFFLAIALAATTLQSSLPFPLRSLAIFAALVALAMVLLSDRLRVRLKSFVSAQFHGGQHDYREIWLAFTRRTAAIVEERPLCAAVGRMVAEMFDALSVTIWLFDDSHRPAAHCAGSTVCALDEANAIEIPPVAMAQIHARIQTDQTVVDLDAPAGPLDRKLAGGHADLFKKIRVQYLVPLATGSDAVGFIGVGDRVAGRPLTLEDKNILATIGQQVAASLRNIQLSERLRQGRELEAFQTVSAFFVHDLKNLASKLSMMFQNLPDNFDNPEFREDAVRLMGRSVDKINTICARLSSLREKLEIQPAACDLNHLVETALTGLRPSLNGNLKTRLAPLPELLLDPEQMQKVVTNLVLNAREAAGEGGRIQVETRATDGWAELSVRDNGCGMTADFMTNSLFKPFQTTKKQGTGIGLFQSKMIVEAHGGRIEVESGEGEGALFRVILPEKARLKEKG